ncbi:hypothetical protein GS905_11900 [Rhodococcus hoagii]|uniref:DUF7426 family protein n=1 Tax=Rhodococcus hoagii TaxID=43767 RepID=UPI000A118766|nr:hypothetical protein [Prescottella equi]MBM4615134.1 hypothetical protein [Prescottella equi]MBM4702491.1 hypothetical protein [Prescottella equi]MBM4708137.1 hypothetical protein [Prescottella equi]NKT21602.1 hypothetical protein [Prescottella equi]NKU52516.1 hypothetical protein [Prescottella equi]
MALKDLDTFFEPDLQLPIRGKQYTVPAPDFDEAKRLREEVVANSALPAPAQTHEAINILGPALDEMVADNLPWPMILHAGRTAIAHYGASPDIAEIHWHMAQLGKFVDLGKVAERIAAARKT